MTAQQWPWTHADRYYIKSKNKQTKKEQAGKKKKKRKKKKKKRDKGQKRNGTQYKEFAPTWEHFCVMSDMRAEKAVK